MWIPFTSSWFNNMCLKQPFYIAGDVRVFIKTGTLRLLSCGFDVEDEVDTMFGRINVAKVAGPYDNLFFKHGSKLL